VLRRATKAVHICVDFERMFDVRHYYERWSSMTIERLGTRVMT
jgi:hypothetical protein